MEVVLIRATQMPQSEFLQGSEARVWRGVDKEPETILDGFCLCSSALLNCNHVHIMG